MKKSAKFIKMVIPASVLILITCVLFCFEVWAKDSEIKNYNGFEYIIKYDEGYYADIIRYSGDETSVVIPSKIEGYTVYLSGRIFENNTNLINVKISEGIVSLSSHTFAGCINLEKIEIPDTVDLNNEEAVTAFYNCPKLKNIIIGENSKFKSKNGMILSNENDLVAFPSASGNIVLEDGITRISEYAFGGCNNLTGITIPEGVTTVEQGAFWNCSGLKKVVIPSTVSLISGNIFEGCTNLQEVTVATGNKNYKFEDGLLYGSSRDSNALTVLLCIKKSGNVTIPDGVEIIAGNAFEDCASITGVDIPYGVKEIDRNAFRGCKDLTSVIIPESVEYIASGAFSDCSNLSAVVIPKGVEVELEEVGDEDTGYKFVTPFENCSPELVITTTEGSDASRLTEMGFKTKIISEEEMNKILEVTKKYGKKGDSSGDSSKDDSGKEKGSTVIGEKIGTKLKFRKGIYKVTKLGSKSTAGETIPEVALMKPVNKKLKNFTVPATIKVNGITYKVTSISAKAFKNNKKLKTITIGANVKTIGKTAFSGCKSLKKINIKSKNIVKIGSKAFKGINSKAKIKVPKAVLKKYKKMFKKAKAPKGVKITK